MKGKINQVFVPDMTNRREIISHFLDLIDIGCMLDINWWAEMNQFRKKLEESGWNEENINVMIEIACSKSRYVRDLPPMPRNRGSWLEWLNNKSRIK